MTTPFPDPSTLQNSVKSLLQELAEFQEERTNQVYTGASGDGMVSAEVNGMGFVLSISIEPSELALGSTALASKVKEVVNGAIDAADSASSAAASGFAAALSLPGLPAHGSTPPNYPAFASTVSQLAVEMLANNPCESGDVFECRKGNVTAVVDAHRRVVSLTFPDPLPSFAPHLESRAREAINCAVDDGTERGPEDLDGPIDVITDTPGFGRLVIYARGSLKLNDRVQVKTLNCADWAKVGNAGFVETNIGVTTDVGSILSRAHVVVRDRGRVHGFIRTSDTLETQNLTEIDGPIEEHASVILPELGFEVDWPSSTIGTIEPGVGQTQTAAPGYYNKLHAYTNAKVFLSSGVYFLNEFFLEPDAELRLNTSGGPIVIWVKNAFTYRGKIFDSGGGFPRLFIGYLGTSLAAVERIFRGTLAAPNAKINIATILGDHYEGTFHGKDVEVFPDSVICHRPFEIPHADLPGLVPPEGPTLPVVDLGFENISGWFSSNAMLSLAASPTTQGAFSLKFTDVSSTTRIQSAKFSSDLVPSGATRMLVALYVPVTQPNPTFFGNLGVVVSIPSASIAGQTLGTLGLTSLPTGEFSQLEFPLPTNVRQALDESHDDVSLALVFNITPGSEPWYLDNIRFAPDAPPEPPPLDAVLSFEDISKWSAPGVSLTNSTTHKTHLTQSLKVPIAPGWIQIISVPISSAGLSAPFGKFKIDLWVSSNQPNPWWHGQFQLKVSVPSLGIGDAETINVELTPLPKNTFNTLTLTLPTNVKSAIDGSHPDLVLKLILNVPAGAGPYYLDNIRFV